MPCYQLSRLQQRASRNTAPRTVTLRRYFDYSQLHFTMIRAWRHYWLPPPHALKATLAADASGANA